MKLRYYLSAPLLLLSNLTFADSKADSVKILNNKINELQASVDRLNSFMQTSNGSIANSIAGSQHYLTGFTVVFSLIGIAIGLYINSIYNKILGAESVSEKLLNDSTASRDQTIAIQQKVQALSDGINGNLQDVYVKLQNVEIKFILDRLIEAPEEFSLYWDKLNTHYKISQEMQGSFVDMVKKLPKETQAFGMTLLFKYFNCEDLLKDSQISTILTTCTVDVLHVTDAKKQEIIECLAGFYKTGNFNPTYEQIIQKTYGMPKDIKTPLQAIIIKNFGEDYISNLGK